MSAKHVRRGQVWTIGKKTRELVQYYNGVECGNQVEIVEPYGGYGLIKVFDPKSRIRFDVGLNNLGKLIGGDTP
jgi:hypothetical protein